MSGDQHQLVRFSIKPRHMGHITHSQRMLSRLRVRCSQKPPLSLWAGWKTGPIFSKFIISLIFLNTIVLMVEIELMESTNTKLWPLKLALEVADWFILLSFILEILLMWMSSFSLFWKNAWNVFDFAITMLTLLPEFVVLVGVSRTSVWLQLLRISRVLRSLKLFARFRQIKVIILALARALKSMTFLLMLLLIFFYIFAVTGVYFFEDYSRSTIEDLEYNMFFSEASQGKTSEDLLEQSKEFEVSDAEKTDTDKSDAEESDTDKSDAEESDTDKSDAEESDAEESGTDKSDAEESGAKQDEAEEGQKESSKAKDDRVVWPRDSLFRYFELLEKLQYNIEERKKLQEFA
ncbi:hypothetical protein A6R68_18850, partial [Neotoma lepida]